MKSSELNRATCEKQFVINALRKGIRQDGRHFHGHREVSITYGESFGHCEVCIGNTRTLAQVSCEVIKPSQNRPNEGQLFLNVELSPMASQAFESGRPSSQAIEINRFVERCLKESRAIDMESLCIIAGEKVWCLRVDVHVLDDKGNILACACISAIAALAHFRRPDVTVNGKEVTIHSFDDKEAIPLSVHHMPICISLGFVNSCLKPIVDPTDIEELALDVVMIVALNSYMEICCAKMCGVAISPEQVVMCCRIASSRVKEITDKVKKSLDEDRIKRFPNKDRKKKWRVGENHENDILKSFTESTKIDITETIREAFENSQKINKDPRVTTPVVLKDKTTAVIGDGGTNAWISNDDDNMDETYDQFSKDIEHSEKSNRQDTKECIKIDDDESEEEETIQLTNMELNFEIPKNSKSKERNTEKSVDTNEEPQTTTKKKKNKKKKKRPVPGS